MARTSYIPQSMDDWNAGQYRKFEDERTRPAHDLLLRVPLERARLVIDLGCGPGNSTELLVARYPGANVIGVDSSPDMLEQARKRLPNCSFVEASLATWSPSDPPDLLFGNSVFQWIPDHEVVLRRLVQSLPQGGILAAQIPNIGVIPSLVLLRDVAAKGRWANNPRLMKAGRDRVLSLESYYDLIKPLCAELDLWQTTYHHVLAGPEAIVEWFKGSALQPFLSALEPTMIEEFLTTYTAAINRHHSKRVDGRVLLEIPRLFIVVKR